MESITDSFGAFFSHYLKWIAVGFVFSIVVNVTMKKENVLTDDLWLILDMFDGFLMGFK